MYARGSFQREVAEKLLAGQEIVNPIPRKGKASRYALRYKKSLESLFSRMEADGWKVVFTPGPRGGEWSGTYRLIPADLDLLAQGLYPIYQAAERDIKALTSFALTASAAFLGYEKFPYAARLGWNADDISRYVMDELERMKQAEEDALCASFGK